MNVAFHGIGQTMATFRVEEALEKEQVVKVTENGTVGPCREGEAFCGVALPGRGDLAAVVLRGFVTLPYSGAAPALGRVTLAADGQGGVMAGDSGVSALVVEVDTDNLTAVIYL